MRKVKIEWEDGALYAGVVRYDDKIIRITPLRPEDYSELLDDLKNARSVCHAQNFENAVRRALRRGASLTAGDIRVWKEKSPEAVDDLHEIFELIVKVTVGYYADKAVNLEKAEIKLPENLTFDTDKDPLRNELKEDVEDLK